LAFAGNLLALICFGVLAIAVSPGFLMDFLGACIAALGGSAAYLILSHRADGRMLKHRPPQLELGIRSGIYMPKQIAITLICGFTIRRLARRRNNSNCAAK